MDIVVAPKVERYLETLRPDPLAEMHEDAVRRGIPDVGPVVGGLLELLARLIGARRTFEFGSGIGYSAAWIARGMRPEGRLELTDDSQEFVAAARANVQRLGLASRATVHQGDALEIFQRLGGDFDFVFVDCEKRDYPRAFELARPRLRKGGLLVADNVLWGGAVADQKAADEETNAIREFNRLLMSDQGLLSSIVPLRDGVSVSFVL